MTQRDTQTGCLVGVGVGPGDPELLTLKAVAAIREADLIAYPALPDTPSLARRIAAPHVPAGKRELAIEVPMTRDPAPAADAFDRAAATIGTELAAGRTVAVLCEGDPFFYGSFMSLFERLALRFPTRVVPGVSSLMACAAAASHPLAGKNDGLSVLPATMSADRLQAAMQAADAVAVIKVGRHLPKVVEALRASDLYRAAVYVSRATLAEETVVPLTDLHEAEAPYFSMILAHRRGIGA